MKAKRPLHGIPLMMGFILLTLTGLLLFLNHLRSTSSLPFDFLSQAQEPAIELLSSSVSDVMSVVHPTTTLPVTLTHGPVVGAVTPSSARIFARTSAAASVKMRYSTNADMSTPYTETAALSTTLATDYTTQITLTDLSPATTYYYDILVNGTPQFNTPYPQFKTFPQEGTSGTFKVVVLTDFMTTYMDPAQVDTFTNAGDENPDLVIIGGDFDHRNARGESDKRQMFKALYSGENNLEDFVADILRKYPVAHAWDDHDYGEDDANKHYPYRERSLKVLREYFPLYPTSDYGDWQKFTYGQAEFFLVDSRAQRDPKPGTLGDPWDSARSMLDGDSLGEIGQLHWFTDSLKISEATWKVVIMPVVFNTTTIKYDSWYGYQYEKQEILNFISTEGITGVIMVSGDLHFGAIDNGDNAGLPEMLVPSPNMGSCLVSVPGGDLANRGVWSAGTYSTTVGYSCDGYGVLTFETDPSPDQVLLEVKDDEGTTVISYTVGL